MAILKKIIISVLPLFLTACYQDFTPDVDVKPVLCLNALITSGEPIEVSVTRTRLYTEVVSPDDLTVTDAVLKIYVNGSPATSDYLASEGDTILIVADSNNYGHAEALVTVPNAPSAQLLNCETILTEAIDSSTEEMLMAGLIRFNFKAEINIVDNPASDHYFRFSSSVFFPGSEQDLGEDDYPGMDITNWLFSGGTFKSETEPIFSEHIGIFDLAMGSDAEGFCYFTDRQFQGKQYTLHLQFADGSYFVNVPEWDVELLECGYRLTLSSISQSYYNWVNYVWQSNEGMTGDMGNIGFSDPIWGYSNVSTGAGVVAAQSSITFTVNLRDFLANSLSPSIPK